MVSKSVNSFAFSSFLVGQNNTAERQSWFLVIWPNKTRKQTDLSGTWSDSLYSNINWRTRIKGFDINGMLPNEYIYFIQDRISTLA